MLRGALKDSSIQALEHSRRSDPAIAIQVLVLSLLLGACAATGGGKKEDPVFFGAASGADGGGGATSGMSFSW
jgi:hypothetical protein